MPRSFPTWPVFCLLALPAFVFPLYNPDLFWHLSAGRWMLENRTLPRAEFLSFTLPGRPWADFEWLPQIIYQVLHGLGGMPALWLLKAGMLAASWLILRSVLAGRGLSAAWQGAALVLWSAGMLAHSDIRPELFSVLLLTALIADRQRRDDCAEPPGPLSRLGPAALFALWADCHAGFMLGLILCLTYAAAAALQGRLRQAREHAGAALLGGLAVLANPYGYRVYAVVWEHWALRAELARSIKEWQPMSMDNPLYWYFWPVFLILAALIAAAWRKRRQIRIRSWPVAAFALYVGAGSAVHERGSVFFAVAAAAAIPLLLRDLGWDQAPAARRAGSAAVAVYAAFLLWLAPRLPWTGWFQYKHVPRTAVEFMARERTVLEPLRIYNQWEWGGYLAWRLRPWYRIFFDGRYLFHELLAANAEAVKDPALWDGFMREHGLTGALMQDMDRMLPARKRYPDGSVKDFPRPWYFFFMPRKRWALVYWDEQALLFVDRARVPPDWLSRHEYRYLLPHDEAARDEALRLREIPAAALAAEASRHASASASRKNQL